MVSVLLAAHFYTVIEAFVDGNPKPTTSLLDRFWDVQIAKVHNATLFMEFRRQDRVIRKRLYAHWQKTVAGKVCYKLGVERNGPCEILFHLSHTLEQLRNVLATLHVTEASKILTTFLQLHCNSEFLFHAAAGKVLERCVVAPKLVRCQLPSIIHR